MSSRNRVAASEYDLLTLARALVGENGVEVAEPILRSRKTITPKIGPTAMGLLKDTLARGVTLELARRGGWSVTRHLRAGKPISGRLWERHPAQQLRFSKASYLLIRWLTVTPFGLPDAKPLEIEGMLTTGDEVVFYLACDLLTRAGLGPVIAPAAGFGRSPLCWLGFPEQLRGEKAASAPPTEERFAALVFGDGAMALEALQPDLAMRWAALERRKRDIVRCEDMIDLAHVQEALLSAYLDAVEKAGRQDLADFVLEATARLVGKKISGGHWVEGLDPRATLSARASARRAAGSFLRTAARLKRWSDDWRLVRFFDENFDATQMLLSKWERLGDEGWINAESVLRDLESLDVAAPKPKEPLEEAREGEKQA